MNPQLVRKALQLPIDIFVKIGNCNAVYAGSTTFLLYLYPGLAKRGY